MRPVEVPILPFHSRSPGNPCRVLTSCADELFGTRRQGKNIFYSVADPSLLEILALLYRLYCPKEK